MKLSQILSQIKTDYHLPDGLNPEQIEVEDVALDSRLVKKNSVFFALQGKERDGTDFIPEAIKNGASLIISNNCRPLLLEFLRLLYTPLPSNIYAVTGTNGKTSTAEFTRQILELLGKKSASIGTLGVICEASIQAQLQNSSLTTPDIVSLYKNLHILKKNGVDDVAIEVSSIGLEQGRSAGLTFASAGFTNFTQDHLDYHKSMEEYFHCKTMIFDQAKSGVLNRDIPEFEKLKEICTEKNIPVTEYGQRNHPGGRGGQTPFLMSPVKSMVEFKLGLGGDLTPFAEGEFQIYNLLCALGSVMSVHHPSESDLENLTRKFDQLRAASGRMQLAGTTPNKAKIYIDFAHTPDALTNVLRLARKLTKTRVLVLFGCGGNRDTTKRPLMGKIACELADLVIITDDNPRQEKPEAIRAEILSACDPTRTLEIPGRMEAIQKAVSLLRPDDILILAGKGHEKYQIIGEEKLPFDEEMIVKKVAAAATFVV
ncbi:MAG: UDP-N-acetylmuramoyl-L-alanyl-D-glutamate--2,6-diaminopimelate ligase [Alphaproteobacteria bacterium]|nr:UDP-N-acetylmuramoyl-L-alanyl-D-glutamate--2,6-diaminopimelate ligase [Alphaproteobacteria bacterium]